MNFPCLSVCAITENHDQELTMNWRKSPRRRVWLEQSIRSGQMFNEAAWIQMNLNCRAYRRPRVHRSIYPTRTWRSRCRSNHLVMASPVAEEVVYLAPVLLFHSWCSTPLMDYLVSQSILASRLGRRKVITLIFRNQVQFEENRRNQFRLKKSTENFKQREMNWEQYK